MKSTIINDILSVLNSDISLENKKAALITMRDSRRGDNRKLLYIVQRMLFCHVLPLKHTEDISVMPEPNKNTYEKLKNVLYASNCSFFNAVCGEFLCQYFHDADLAKKAILFYEQELEHPSVTNEFFYTKVTVAICRIYSKFKTSEFNFNSFFLKSIKHVNKNYDTDGYCILFILNALLSCQENISQLEEAFENAIRYYEQNEDFYRAVKFMEALDQYYRNNKRTEDAKAIRRKIALNQEKAANKYDWNKPEHSQRIISLIHSAMNSWSMADEKSINPKDKG